MRLRTILITAVGLLLLVAVGTMGRIPGTPDKPPPAMVNTPASDCSAREIAAEGTPPPGTNLNTITNQLKGMCAALQRAETNPPRPPAVDAQGRVLARQSCLDMQSQGYLPGADCGRIPPDTVYYTRR
jgi:hypothetical protein